MKRFDIRIVGGILLVVAGILSLLQTLGILAGANALFWALLFGAGGLVFIYLYLANREHWWPLIPGLALLSLGAIIGLNRFAPRVGEAWGGVLVLGAISLAFWAIYFANREHWWAVIPGGVLLTLAVVAGVSSFVGEAGTGAIFFLGLGLTFGLLSFLPTKQGRMKWMLIPAVVLLAMGLLTTAVAAEMLQYIGPAALILVGLYLALRVFLPRQGQ